MEEVEGGTVYSELVQMLLSVGARHSYSVSVAGWKKENDVDTPFPGGVSLDLDDNTVNGGVEGRDGEKLTGWGERKGERKSWRGGWRGGVGEGEDGERKSWRGDWRGGVGEGEEGERGGR